MIYFQCTTIAHHAHFFWNHTTITPPHFEMAPPWLCSGVGGGEKKGKRKRGGEKRRRGEKEKKLIVYRYMCLRVYLYAI